MKTENLKTENAFAVFNEETLNEMAMENVEGGAEAKTQGEKLPNNCKSGNCVAGCGATPTV
jgi:hypothetical protein